MKLPLPALAAALLAGCYDPPPPAMQQSYAFDRHPGVFLETWWVYDSYGVAHATTRLVNRSAMDKCAWAEALPSRRLHAGETWDLGQLPPPGGVGVANVVPADPDCVNARG